MKIAAHKDDTLIEFGNNLNIRIKILFFYFGVISLFNVLLIFYDIYTDIWQIKYINNSFLDPTCNTPFSTNEKLLSVFSLIIYSIIVFRFFKRINNKESILVTPDSLFVINVYLINRKITKYDIGEISSLMYCGVPNKTDHPLKGQSFDYLGFDSQEYVIRNVNNDGNISFVYNQKQINFGKEVYSWDAEKIDGIFNKITGGKLRIGNITNELSEEGTDNNI